MTGRAGALGKIAVAGGALAAWSWWRVVSAARPRPLVPADMLVLFGAGLVDGRPDPAFAMRIERATELYRAGWAPSIVCSGGPPEVEEMVGQLAAAGVPSQALVPDPTGVSTRATVRAVRRLASQPCPRVIAVSSSYHMRRILSECRRQGVSAQPGRPDPQRPWWRLWVVMRRHRARSILREMAAIWWYAVSSIGDR